MRYGKKLLIVTTAVLCMAFILERNTVSAKTSQVKIDLTGSAVLTKRPIALEKAKKVSVKCNKKSVVKAQYKKNRKDKRIVFTAKKLGTATVTVKCTMKSKAVKAYKYKVKVIRSKKVTSLDKAKKAFEIQNQYRKEKGITPLEWSDELYQFCVYRLKTSGFDGHKNLGRDTVSYFGAYSKYKVLMFAENMYSGSSNSEDAMKSWKNSSEHYNNLLASEHLCGAIACSNNIWCAIFYDKDKVEIENWRSYQIKEIKVRRYDSQSNTYIGNCSIGYYEEDNHWGSLQTATITEAMGKSIYLEIGKTYVIYEKKTPDGFSKAQRVTITVTQDGVSEVILTG